MSIKFNELTIEDKDKLINDVFEYLKFDTHILKDNEHSVLTGAATGTTIHYLMNKKHKPIINDIDVFIPSEEDFGRNLYYGNTSPSEYFGKYEVLSSDKKDKLNIVTVAFPEEKYERPIESAILKQFDLNFTQAGISYNREADNFNLHLSNEFAQYIDNDIICVTNVCTILQTALRLIKKQKEMEFSEEIVRDGIKLLSTAFDFYNTDNYFGGTRYGFDHNMLLGFNVNTVTVTKIDFENQYKPYKEDLEKYYDIIPLSSGEFRFISKSEREEDFLKQLLRHANNVRDYFVPEGIYYNPRQFVHYYFDRGFYRNE